MSHTFKKRFLGATGGNPFPKWFEPGDVCPDDLVRAATEVDALEKEETSALRAEDLARLAKPTKSAKQG